MLVPQIQREYKEDHSEGPIIDLWKQLEQWYVYFEKSSEILSAHF